MVAPQEFRAVSDVFRARVGVIKDLSAYFGGKGQRSLPDLSGYKAVLARDKGSERFVEVIDSLSSGSGAAKTVADMLGRVRRLVEANGKWFDLYQVMKHLTDPASVACSKDGYNSRKWRLKSKLVDKGWLAPAVDWLAECGFEVKETRAFMDALISEVSDTTNVPEALCRDSNNQPRKVPSFVNKLTGGAVNHASLAAELAVPLAYFRRMKTDSPAQLLASWDEDVAQKVSGGVSAGKSVGQTFLAIIAKERNIAAPQSTVDAIQEHAEGLRDLSSQGGVVADLVQRSGYEEVAQAFIQEGEAVAGRAPTNNDREVRAAEDLKKAVAAVQDALSKVNGYVQESELPPLLLGLSKAVDDVVKKLGPLTSSTSAPTSALFGPSFGRRRPGSASSAWAAATGASSFVADVIQPFDAARNRGEQRPDLGRLELYRDMMKAHADRTAQDPVVNDVKTARENARIIVKNLASTRSDPNCNVAQVRAGILGATKAYVRNVERALAKFERRHSDFVMWTNRRTLEYMLKWYSVRDMTRGTSPLSPQDRKVIAEYFESARATAGSDLAQAVRRVMGNVEPLVPDAEREAILEYFKHLADTARRVQGVIDLVERESLSLFTDSSVTLVDDDYAAEAVQGIVSRLEARIVSTRLRVLRMYSASGYNALDVLRDPTFLIMYVLKGLRVLLVWAALTFASGIFTPLYTDAVYKLNKAPPSPLWFVLIFVAIDMGLNLAMLVVLLALKYMFDAPGSGFPVNGHLLKAYAIDYAVSTAMLTALSLVIASVIARKKYFRYRFEGDRGIRAMRDMLLLVATAILFVPYFRFVN